MSDQLIERLYRLTALLERHEAWKWTRLIVDSALIVQERRRMMAWLHSSRLHLVLVLVWIALIWPTVSLWHDSVLWVGLISVYANVVSHWGAYQSARAEEEVRRAA